VRLASREIPEQDQAEDTLVEELVSQELTRLTAYELGWLNLTWARILHANGRPSTAEGMYRNAVRLAGEYPQSPSLRSLAAADSVPARYRRVATLLAEGVCGQLECLVPQTPRAEDKLSEQAMDALRLATDLDDSLTVIRLCGVIESSYGITKFRPLLERHVDLGFAMYADSQRRHRWQAARKGPPWPLSIDRAEIEAGGARALELAKALARVSLAMGQHLEDRIHEALGTDRSALTRDAPATESGVHERTGDAAPQDRSEVISAGRVSSNYHPRLGGPRWLAGAESLTGGPCVTLRLGWELSAELGHRTTGIEHLLAAALADAESAAAFGAAGLDPDRLREMANLVAGGNDPETVTTAAEQVLRRARELAEQSGANLVRPWHVVVATLTSSPSSAHAVLAAAGVGPEEVIARLVNGANNLGLDGQYALLPEPSGLQLSLPVRAILSRAAHWVARGGGGKTGLADVMATVVDSPATSPELRSRAARLTDVDHAPRTGMDRHGGWSAGLQSVLSAASGVATPWLRGVDVADLIRTAEGHRSGPDQSNAPAQVSEPLRRLVKHGITLATNAGHSYVGPEHLAAALETGPMSVRGWVPTTYVFTPQTQQWFAAATTVAADAVVAVEHLRATRQASFVSRGSSSC
jgi:hypothetical protein